MLVFPHTYRSTMEWFVQLSGVSFIYAQAHVRSCGVSVAAIWSCTLGECFAGFGFFFCGYSQCWCFSNFSASLPLFPLFPPLLSQCDEGPDVPVWGLMAGLQGLQAMGTFYCLGAGWLVAWDVPWTSHAPTFFQLDAVVNCSHFLTGSASRKTCNIQQARIKCKPWD